MNIDALKEALGDEKFAELKSHIDDLTGQRDAARKESIEGRKGLKAKLDAAVARVAALEDWGGIESGADLEALPAPKGQADAVKQYEAKLKRADREREEALKSRDEAIGKVRQAQQRAAVADAIGAHEFIARDIVETYVGQRLTWEGDEVLFRSDDGRLIPIKDGVAGIAKSRPELLKSQGSGGANFKGANAGGSGDRKTITRKAFEALPAHEKPKAASEMQIVD